ncbi:helix-turn-helix transcriptional regulator [Arcobacter lacus]|uniref:helix-turn-helix domain-containing protein n=1 Tax=Arcobacter lacus TaxID=1912876 RepID=UPI0021BB61B6|nr:helix-turn-helix transcriptional regulator [Arcobacter lacus]MCT7910684.1 helix-turn-helix transcriptional regulator [Arcobacter lacus]
MSNKRLKEIRANNNLTQEEFAECINLKQTKIRDIENNKAKVTVEIAMAIEDKFGINLRWLLSGRGNMFIEDNISENYVISQNGNRNLALNGKQIHININKDDVEILEYFKKLAPKKQEYYSHLIKADVLKEEMEKEYS